MSPPICFHTGPPHLLVDGHAFPFRRPAPPRPASPRPASPRPAATTKREIDRLARGGRPFIVEQSRPPEGALSHPSLPRLVPNVDNASESRAKSGSGRCGANSISRGRAAFFSQLNRTSPTAHGPALGQALPGRYRGPSRRLIGPRAASTPPQRGTLRRVCEPPEAAVIGSSRTCRAAVPPCAQRRAFVAFVCGSRISYESGPGKAGGDRIFPWENGTGSYSPISTLMIDGGCSCAAAARPVGTATRAAKTTTPTQVYEMIVSAAM